MSVGIISCKVSGEGWLAEQMLAKHAYVVRSATVKLWARCGKQ